MTLPLAVTPPLTLTVAQAQVLTFFFTEPAAFYGLDQVQIYEHDEGYTQFIAAANVADDITYNWTPGTGSNPSPVVTIAGLTVTIDQPDETGFYWGDLSITAVYGNQTIIISLNISPLT